MKKLFAVIVALAMMLGCISAFAETAVDTTLTNGTATIKGFGGDITVTVILDGENIKDVIIDGPGETEGIGQKIIDEWPLAFLEYNGMECVSCGSCSYGCPAKRPLAANITAMRRKYVDSRRR